mmetsp:Transcript_2628/g.7885  ORF Transcript_2628/g.7885 Transcript_2628/m.7885 type:complete len:310 (+) Transcript_2628:125-1054(+)
MPPSRTTLFLYSSRLDAGHEVDVAAGGGGVGGEDVFLGEAADVVGAAGLGTGAGEAGAAEGLGLDDGGDGVAVDVEVAGVGRGGEEGVGGVEAGVEAGGEAEAEFVDAAQEVREGVGGAGVVRQQVQHRTEALAPGEVVERRHEKDGRRVEGRRVGVREAVAVQLRSAREELGLPPPKQLVDVGSDSGAGGSIDEGSAVDGEVGRVAEAEFGDGAGEHRQHDVLGLLRNEEQARGRAALPGAHERGPHRVRHELLGQRRLVGYDSVQPRRLSDERRERRVVRTFAQRFRDVAGGRERARKGHAVDPSVL